PPNVCIDSDHRPKHGVPRCYEASHGGRQTICARACLKRLLDEVGTERAWKPGPKYHGQTTDLVLQCDTLPDQLFACGNERSDGMGRQGLDVHWFEEGGSSQLRQTTRVVAIWLGRGECFERLACLAAFNADDRYTVRDQAMVEHRRHTSCLKHHPSARRHF